MNIKRIEELYEDGFITKAECSRLTGIPKEGIMCIITFPGEPNKDYSEFENRTDIDEIKNYYYGCLVPGISE